jgi:hypothetical protein
LRLWYRPPLCFFVFNSRYSLRPQRHNTVTILVRARTFANPESGACGGNR